MSLAWFPSETKSAYRERVGFDPQRKHQRSNFDYWYVGAALVLCAALVLWAFLG